MVINPYTINPGESVPSEALKKIKEKHNISGIPVAESVKTKNW